MGVALDHQESICRFIRGKGNLSSKERRFFSISLRRSMRSSTVISIPEEEVDDHKTPSKEERVSKFSLSTFVLRVRERVDKQEMRKLIHGFKVGIALVLVSLLYLLYPLYKEVGENAMWAIMTVVVMFEFFAGATLCKGINRGIGTVIGGGLGCLAAALAEEAGGIGKAIIVGTSVFIFGAGATYLRLVPRIKKTYDYGVMIFILTFNLVVVSGLRAEKVMELAQQRLSTIGMGFAICIFISLTVFPTWASDELHSSIAIKFDLLAQSIQGCLEEYFDLAMEKETPTSTGFVSSCKSVLNSKSKDESLANFAKWEPWHGKFGLKYPWKKYLQVGELAREIAATTLSLRGCLQSSRQPSPAMRLEIKEQSEAAGSSMAGILRELGERVMKMRRNESKAVILERVKLIKEEMRLIRLPSSSSKHGETWNGDRLGMASFLFLMMEIVEKVEEMAKLVEELAEVAGFHNI